MRLLQHHVDRHAAGRHRLAQRLAQVDLAGTRPPPPRGQPGRERAGQRCHHPPHLAQLLAGRAQELDVLGQLRDAVHLHVVAAELFGGAPLRLGLHHLAQLRDPLGRKSLGDLLLRRRRLVAVRRQQTGQQPALQIVQAHRLERLIRRVRRAPAGVVPAVRLDDLGDHCRQPLVHVGQLFVVGQHVEQCLPHRLDVVGRQAVGRRRRPRRRARSWRPARPGTTGRTSRRRYRGGRVGASTAHAMPSRSVSRSPSPSTPITRPASTVSDGPTEIPCPRSASTNSTRWPGIPCGANGCGGRVRRTAIS